MKVTLLQWNVWYREKRENIVSLLRKYNPDIICLQELTQNCEYNDYQDVAEYITQETGFFHHFSAANSSSEGQSIGNGIFSKYPITERSQFFVATQVEGSMDYSDEGRSCALVKIFCGEKTLEIATTHLSYTDRFIETEKKMKEVNKLIEGISGKDTRFILTGDFNLLPDSKSLERIRRIFKDCGPHTEQNTWTTKPFSYNGFEAHELGWRLDYVFSTEDITVLSSRVIKTPYSDHLPLLIEMEI